MFEDPYNFIKSALPKLSLSNSSEDLQAYGRDWLKDFKPAPSCIAFPTTTEEVQSLIIVCKEKGIAIVPSGGRTGLSGGATACNGEVIVSLDKMRRILEIDSVSRTVTCEAGVVTEALQTRVKESNLYFPIDFSSRGSSQIGGNIATNAGGIRVLRYGNIRESVVGLKVVTGNGEILDLNGKLFKNNTGYDLRSLFIGSEGTLGIITEATLRLHSEPGELTRILCGMSDLPSIISLFTKVRAEFSELSAFEFMEAPAMDEVIRHRKLTHPFDTRHPYYILVELEHSSDSVISRAGEFFMSQIESGAVENAVISDSRQRAAELMDLRDLISETLSSNYVLHKNDISVPISEIPNFIPKLHERIHTAYSDFAVRLFGHIGDGNLHVNILKPQGMETGTFFEKCKGADKQIFALVKEFSGSISAEHGVGMLKRDFLGFSRSEEEIRLMREIKKIFDPAGIMNPGKVLSKEA